MRGHKSVTDSYFCQHPDLTKEKLSIFFDSIDGRQIHFNIEGSCTTPSWCPFIKPKTQQS